MMTLNKNSKYTLDETFVEFILIRVEIFLSLIKIAAINTLYNDLITMTGFHNYV